MSATMSPQFSTHSNDPSHPQKPPKTPRAKIACNKCRGLKIKCANKDDGTPCEACVKKNIHCQYTEPGSANASASPRTPTSPTLIESSAMVRDPSGSSAIVRQGTTGANCLCGIPGEHVCVIPQIPVGQLSEAVNALGLENAQRYPGMQNSDDRNR